MRIINKQTSELMPYARNSRTHSEQQVAQIAAAIREFGWTNPILIKSDNTVIAGHGRLMAAKEIGMLKVPCIVLDNLSDEQCRALVIADNKLALNAGWDMDILISELSELKDLDFDFEIIGFSDEELNSIINGLYEEDGDESDDGDIDNIKQPTKPLLQLRVGKVVIPLTEDEYNALVEKVDEYVEKKGVPFGFIGGLLGTKISKH